MHCEEKKNLQPRVIEPHSLLVVLITEQPMLKAMYSTTITLQASVISNHMTKLRKVSRIICVQNNRKFLKTQLLRNVERSEKCNPA